MSEPLKNAVAIRVLAQPGKADPASLSNKAHSVIQIDRANALRHSVATK
jgi:hypothetical protein